MTKENQDLLENLYRHYKEPVKPLLAEIEALYERFPLAIYNEIRAMNDHVARAYIAIDDDEARIQINKAYSHIRRITRDCYKFLNLYYKEEAEKFDELMCLVEPMSKADFERTDKYAMLYDSALQNVRIAKMNEHLLTDDETYENYERAYLSYKDLHKFIDENRGLLLSMHRKRRYQRIGGIFFSFVTFVLGCILTNNNEAILGWFNSLFKMMEK